MKRLDSPDQLATSLGQVLQARNWTISCAESCTGGGLAYAITSVAGSSAWFEQSFVTYSNSAKQVLVDVDEEILESFGAVSRQTVEAMAEGCAVTSRANVTIAISGVAGPGGGTIEKPVGLVWFGFFINGQIHSVKCQFAGDRTLVREQAVIFALAKSSTLIKSLI